MIKIKRLAKISFLILMLSLPLAGTGALISKPQNPLHAPATTNAFCETDEVAGNFSITSSGQQNGETEFERVYSLQTKTSSDPEFTLPERKEFPPGSASIIESVATNTPDSTVKTSVSSDSSKADTTAAFTSTPGITTSQTAAGHPAGTVALTFDDGPGPYTGQLLDSLQAYGIRASFFVLGNRAESFPGLISRMYSEGHQLGNHSYSHLFLSQVDATTLHSQLSQTNDIIAGITGERPVVMRPPGGYGNHAVFEEAGRQGMATVYWNVDTADWKYKDSRYVCNYLLNNISGGSIVLMHDIHKTTVDGFIMALPVLVERGFNFVTVNELIALKPGEVYPNYWR